MPESSAYDAVIVLGGGVTPEGRLSTASQSRVDYALTFCEREDIPLVLSGKWSLLLNTDPAHTEAFAMRERVLALGGLTAKIYLEEESMDTIGNAYFTKTKIMDPRHWQHAVCVTSEFHVPRAKSTFHKIFGPGYTLDFVAAPSGLSRTERTEKQRVEAAIAAFTYELLKDVTPGDDAATWEALQQLPGYGTQPTFTRKELQNLLQLESADLNTYGLSGK